MCSLPSRPFVKSALLQNVCTLVIRCVPPALFTHKYRGQIMGAVSTTDKTFGPFSELDFSPKKKFPRRVFSSQNVNKENSSGNFTCLRYRAFTYSPLYLTHKLTLVLLENTFYPFKIGSKTTNKPTCLFQTTMTTFILHLHLIGCTLSLTCA